MTTFTNEKDLLQTMKVNFRYVVQYVMENILEENERDIMEVIYGKYAPNTYERRSETTGDGFADAWDIAIHSTSALGGNNIVEGSFFYAPSKMGVEPPSEENGNMGQHHGIDEYGDSRKYLADIIYEGLSGKIYGSGAWTKKRNAFDLLEKRIGKAKMKKLFEEGMNEVGLVYERHNRSIEVKRTK